MSPRRWLVLPSIAIHVGIIILLLFVGAWKLDRLDAGKSRIDLRVAAAPPPEAAGSPAKPAKPFDHKTHKEVPKVIVVPPEHPVVPEVVATTTSSETATGTGNGTGTGSGSGSGSSTGTSDSPCTADCGEVVHERVETQKIIPPQLLSGLRLAGETQLQPPDMEKTAMHREGRDRVIASFQICLDGTGNVVSTHQLKSTGYAGYDAELVRGLGTWRYKPYTLNGRGIAVCSVVTFIYSMK